MSATLAARTITVDVPLTDWHTADENMTKATLWFWLGFIIPFVSIASYCRAVTALRVIYRHPYGAIPGRKGMQAIVIFHGLVWGAYAYCFTIALVSSLIINLFARQSA